MAENELINRITSSTDGNGQKTALQFAFYNTLLFVLVGVCFAGLYAVYNMMHMFLSPILWAILVGTVLFPIKRRVSSSFKGWLKHLDELDKPLVIGLITFPYERFCDFADGMLNMALSATGVYSIISYLIIKILSYQGTLSTLLSIIGQFYEAVDVLIVFFTQRWFLPVLILYSLAYAAWIYVQDRQAIHKKFARSLSIPIWILLLAYVSELFGVFRVIVFLCSCIILLLISAGLMVADDENDEIEEKSDSPTETNAVETKLEAKSYESLAEARIDTALSGDAHIRIIVGLCVLLFLARHDSMLVLIFLPLFFAILRAIAYALKVPESLESLLQNTWNSLHANLIKLVNIVVPGSLRKFIKLLFTSDRMFVSGLNNNVDLISSILVMMFLAIGSSFAIFFIAFQLHSEVAHLIKLGGNVINSHPEWARYISNFTEDQMKELDLDNYVEHAYQQGRTWLGSNIRSLADPKDKNRADQLERQAQILIDNLYKLWEERNMPNNSIYNANHSALVSENENVGWVTHLISTVNVNALRIEVTRIVQENIDTVLSILRSLWSVVAMNISVLSSILFAILGFILGFGFDILNFVIETIVFLTVVYYLLVNSRENFLPFSWLKRLSESFSQTQVSKKTDITSAVENAISGVFVLSAKMAIFYGLYTYFVHSLFDLNVVFIPSISAAIFAAIPLMPPYIVAIFGAFELYLVRGETAAAIIFCLASVAPLTFADATFYRELRGSHPYVTGLAVIGGMYWLGLQGAIIGPIILCSLIVLINVYTQFAQ